MFTGIESEMNECASDPYEAALQKAINELSIIESDYRKALESVQLLIIKRQKLIDMISYISDQIGIEQRGYYINVVSEITSGNKIEKKGGSLINDVINIINIEPKKEWTANEIKSKLTRDIEPIEQKTLHNILNYLYRKGDLKRVGRGVYRVVSSGIGVHCDDPNLDLVTGEDMEGTY